MTPGQGLLFVTAALAAYSVGQVWLVQMSSYRLFAYVGAADFHRYHRAWWRSIWGVVLGPGGLVLLGSLLMLHWSPPAARGWALWLGAGLQVVLYASTAAWFGPLMARLATPGDGMSARRYRLLMRTHWVHVAIVTAYGLLVWWMLAADARA